MVRKIEERRERVGRSPEFFSEGGCVGGREIRGRSARDTDTAGVAHAFTTSSVEDVRRFFSHRSTLRRAPSSSCCVLRIARWRLAATATPSCGGVTSLAHVRTVLVYPRDW